MLWVRVRLTPVTHQVFLCALSMKNPSKVAHASPRASVALAGHIVVATVAGLQAGRRGRQALSGCKAILSDERRMAQSQRLHLLRP